MRSNRFSKSAAIFCSISLLAIFGSDGTPAATVVLNPGDNIQSLVNANPAGTTYLFNPGTYHLQNIRPKTGNVFDGQGRATLDGNDVAKTAFSGTADNVTIRNLTIQNYHSDFQEAAVDTEDGDGWIVQNNTIGSNFSIGVNFGTNSQILGNRLVDNGQAGFAGGGAGWLVSDNHIARNNTRNLDWGFEAGGGKVTDATSGTFRGNLSYDNMGPGIWLDGDANNIVIEENVCFDNYAPGIMVEISRNTTVRNNTLLNNGILFRWDYASIVISSSENNLVYGNFIDTPVDRQALFINSQERTYDAINNEVFNNRVWIRGTDENTIGVDQDDDAPVFTKNKFRDNQYYVHDFNVPYFSWESDHTLEEAQELGRELGSTMQRIDRILGDYNRNGAVDAIDYTLWRNQLGSTTLNPFDGPDGNGDGKVNMADYIIWRSNFGDTSIQSTLAVPEPAPVAAVMSLVGIVSLRGRWR